MNDWERLDAGLAPWRRLGRPRLAASIRQGLREDVLAQVVGVDPLAIVDSLVTIAGDWHGDATWATRAIELAAVTGSRLLLQLGDFGLWPGDAGEGYLDVVELACRRRELHVLWIDGNHEDFDRLARYPLAPNGLRPVRPHVWHLLRGTRWTWHAQTWLAVGGAVSVDRAMRVPSTSWWPQEAITPEEASTIATAGAVDVMLTHDRPAMAQAALGELPGSWHARGLANGWARRDLVAADAHSALLQTVVDAARPSRLFHGHLHERYDALIDPTSWGGTCRVTGLDQQGGLSNLVQMRLPV